SSSFLVLPVFFARHGAHRDLPPFPTRRSSDLGWSVPTGAARPNACAPHRNASWSSTWTWSCPTLSHIPARCTPPWRNTGQRSGRSEEHTSELQSRENLVCRLLLEKKKKQKHKI